MLFMSLYKFIYEHGGDLYRTGYVYLGRVKHVSLYGILQMTHKIKQKQQHESPQFVQNSLSVRIHTLKRTLHYSTK